MPNLTPAAVVSIAAALLAGCADIKEGFDEGLHPERHQAATAVATATPAPVEAPAPAPEKIDAAWYADHTTAKHDDFEKTMLVQSPPLDRSAPYSSCSYVELTAIWGDSSREPGYLLGITSFSDSWNFWTGATDSNGHHFVISGGYRNVSADYGTVLCEEAPSTGVDRSYLESIRHSGIKIRFTGEGGAAFSERTLTADMIDGFLTKVDRELAKTAH